MSLRLPSYFATALIIIQLAIPSLVNANSDITGTIQLSAGHFNPDIGTKSEQQYYNATFAEDSLEATLMVAKYFPQELLPRSLGQFGLRLQLGQWRVSSEESDTASAAASLRVIPLNIGVTYRLDSLWRLWAIPVIGYATSGVSGYVWQGKGPFREVAKNQDSAHETLDVTSGYFVSVSLGLNLDPLFSSLRSNSKSYRIASLLIEWQRNWLNNFKGKSDTESLDLSGDQWRIGLALDF